MVGVALALNLFCFTASISELTTVHRIVQYPFDEGRGEGVQGVVLPFLFVVGLDYLLKWWGSADSEALGGQLDVIWKVMEGGSVACYKSWIKLAERDFILGVYKEEGAKREANRAAFREAFAQWKGLLAHE